MAVIEPPQKECEAWYSELGWHFDKSNDFVDKNDNLFQFQKYEAYYEYVHSRIKDHLFSEMKRQFDLVRQPVSMDNSDDPVDPEDPYVPQIFLSKDVSTNKNLLVIIQGLGLVPPGQWARKLFTNGKRGEFKYASQFPYIQKAKELGWAVILCDPNHILKDNQPQSERTRAQHVQRHSHAFVLNERKGSPDNVEEVPGARDHDTVPGAAIDIVFKYLEDKMNEYEKSKDEEKKSKEDEETQGDLETPKEDDDKDTEQQGKQGDATTSIPEKEDEDVKPVETEPSKKDNAESAKTDGDELVGDRTLEKRDESQVNKSMKPDEAEKFKRPDNVLEVQDPLEKSKKGRRKAEVPSGDDQAKEVDGAKRVRLQK
ncbi:hypothetical protein BG000_012049 [Podila horticola]|nr:hypothetical protein BG000_012049 [Podila horticola]